MTSPSIAAVSLPSDADASGRSFDVAERELLQRALDSGTLNCTRGKLVRELTAEFAKLLGIPHCHATTSGTAAVHAAIAALDPSPGDEVITTPITDMGAITPILYQTAIPVFADVDPHTYMVTAETIERRITNRTRAVVVTHLFGNCAEMGPIIDLCRRRGLLLIEDAAQALLATHGGRLTGTMGDIGCFSLQQGKHMTCGEGGLVVTKDAKLSRRIKLFIDKAWDYEEPASDHYFLALNYRMTELQGAVALAQLRKLPEMVAHRVRMVERLTQRIAGLKGVHPPAVVPGSRHVYWRYPLRIDAQHIAGGAVGFGEQLRKRGVYCKPRYIEKPAFQCALFRDRRTFGNSQFPFVGEHRRGEPPINYDGGDTPGTFRALAEIVVLPWNERYQDEHVAQISEAIRSVATALLT
jgi:dTDP-4-amino-4,6-dideoxygalactose transaminase